MGTEGVCLSSSGVVLNSGEGSCAEVGVVFMSDRSYFVPVFLTTALAMINIRKRKQNKHVCYRSISLHDYFR